MVVTSISTLTPASMSTSNATVKANVNAKVNVTTNAIVNVNQCQCGHPRQRHVKCQPTPTTTSTPLSKPIMPTTMPTSTLTSMSTLTTSHHQRRVRKYIFSDYLFYSHVFFNKLIRVHIENRPPLLRMDEFIQHLKRYSIVLLSKLTLNINTYI